MTKKERITEIIALVLEKVTLMDVFQGRVQELQEKGTQLLGLCPFHNDNRVGSFSGHIQKGIWHCFSCGVGGNQISFVRDYEKLHGNDYDFVETALYLAKEYHLISDEEYDGLVSKKFSKTEIHEFETNFTKKITKEQLAPISIRNKVYTLFSKANEYTGGSRLSDEHLTHLKEVRHLTDEIIKEQGYFTFPKRFILRKFLIALENEGLSPEILKGIPGFFYDKIRETWSFMTIPVSGIGIPIRNINQEIVAIQIRKDTVSGKELRYTWFSSAFAQMKENYKYGCSSGSPIGIFFPKNKPKSIMITEGHFKAIPIKEKMQALALYVQGVTNWKGLLPIVTTSKAKIPELETGIVFDADMGVNKGVSLQAIKLGLNLLNIPELNTELINEMSVQMNLDIKKYPQKNPLPLLRKIYSILYNHPEKCKHIYYYIWDMNKGKGIDDFLETHSISELYRINIDVFFTNYVHFYLELEKKEKKSLELEDEEIYKIFKEKMKFD